MVDLFTLMKTRYRVCECNYENKLKSTEDTFVIICSCKFFFSKIDTQKTNIRVCEATEC